MTDIILYINSGIDRNSKAGDTTSKWTTTFPTAITSGLSQRASAKVEYIDFPNSMYTFPWHSYKFWFIRNAGTTDNLTSIDIDNTKNWANGSDLVVHLNALMTAAGYTITFSYNTDTSKISITNSLANPIKLVSSYRFIDGTALYAQISYECTDRLGFTDNYTNVNIANGGTYTAPSILRLLRSHCYYLCCDELAKSSVKQSHVPDAEFTPSIITRISASNFGSLSQLEYSTNYELTTDQGKVKNLSFYVLDDELYDIRNNGVPITFALKITFL